MRGQERFDGLIDGRQNTGYFCIFCLLLRWIRYLFHLTLLYLPYLGTYKILLHRKTNHYSCNIFNSATIIVYKADCRINHCNLFHVGGRHCTQDRHSKQEVNSSPFFMTISVLHRDTQSPRRNAFGRMLIKRCSWRGKEKRRENLGGKCWILCWAVGGAVM